MLLIVLLSIITLPLISSLVFGYVSTAVLILPPSEEEEPDET